MSSSQLSRLPSDMEFEILSRTTLQTMDACKAVSKEWQDLIFQPSFMTSYCEATKNLFGYVVQNLVSHKHRHEFVSPNKLERSFHISPFKYDNIKIEASSVHGILCCMRRIGFHYRYYVCKPTTGQWQALPNPKRPHLTTKVAIAVVSLSPLRYKIIRVSEPRFFYNYRCEIFDSKTWAWKEAEDVVLSRENWFDYNPAVYTSGSVCFLTDDYIVAFHVDQETKFTISLPESLSTNDHSHYKRIVEYQGKLGLTCETAGCVELWLLRDWNNGIWEMIKRFNIDVLAREIMYPSPAGFYNSEIALMKAYSQVVFWNLRDCSFKEIKLPDLKIVHDSFPFRSDWEPVNLRPEETFSVHSRKKKLKKPVRDYNSDAQNERPSLCS